MSSFPSRERDLLIALSLLPFLTPSRTRLLLEYFDPLERLCSTSAATIASLLNLTKDDAARVRNPFHEAGVEVEVAALRANVITLVDPHYPHLLREIIDPPLVLTPQGERALLTTPSIAVVGSRRASPYGMNVANKLAGELAAAGVTVVSGLARGIDAAAHRGALEAGGKTIAVIGTGIDIVYPRSHRRLFEAIGEQGVIVSEFAAGTPPRAPNFPIRNRLISGLSLGTVIVEATGRSGSLITARLAAEQGREVFAVPGSIFSAGSEGVHRLIQYGAKLVHDAGDILDEIPQLRRPEKATEGNVVSTVEPELRRILELVPFDEPMQIDEAASRLGVEGKTLAEPLLTLEVRGLITSMPGARYLRIARPHG